MSAASILLPPVAPPPAAPGEAGAPAASSALGEAADFASALLAKLLAPRALAPTLADPADAPAAELEAPAPACDPDAPAAASDALAALALALLPSPVAEPVAPIAERASASAALQAGQAIPAPRFATLAPGHGDSPPAHAREDVPSQPLAPPAAETSVSAIEPTPAAVAAADGQGADTLAGIASREAAAAVPTPTGGARKDGGRAGADARSAPTGGSVEPSTSAAAPPAAHALASRVATQPAASDGAPRSLQRAPAGSAPNADDAAPAAPSSVATDATRGGRRAASDRSSGHDGAPIATTAEAPVARAVDPVSPSGVASPPVELVARSQHASATATTAPPVPVEAVPAHVEWLAARGGGSARLRLDPPHLGPIDVSVSVRGERVEVVFTAHEAATPQLVHGQREALGAALAARDLRLDHFEVRGIAGADAASARALEGDLARQGGNAPYQDPQQAPERRPEPRAPGGGAPSVRAQRAFDVAGAGATPARHRIDLRV